MDNNEKMVDTHKKITISRPLLLGWYNVLMFNIS